MRPRATDGRLQHRQIISRSSACAILVIPTPLIVTVLVCFHRTEGVDTSGIDYVPLPGLADGVDNGVVAIPEAVREKGFLEVEPGSFDRVLLGEQGVREAGVMFSGTTKWLAQCRRRHQAADP